MELDDRKTIDQTISIDNYYLIDIDWYWPIDDQCHRLLSIFIDYIDFYQRTDGDRISSPGCPDLINENFCMRNIEISMFCMRNIEISRFRMPC